MIPLPAAERLDLELTPRRIALLCAFAAATILLIPADLWRIGCIPFALSAWLAAADPEPKLRSRIGVLLVCVAILALCDINPTLSNRNFLQVGFCFSAVIILPALWCRFFDRGTIRFRLWPEKWEKRELIYILLAFPLAWNILSLYGWGNRMLFDDELFRHWTLPNTPEPKEIRRLFFGINLVGIWDELFFINTAFVLLRSLFRFRIANTVQAVLYTAVLYDMAFTGCGIVIVMLFAWTQGSMFEKSSALLGVLIVHLIVDFFLVTFILHSYYPDVSLGALWRLTH